MMYLVLAVLLLVAVIVVLVLRQPKHLRFSRKVKISATKAKVYKQIGSLRAYNTWNPWATDDPTQEVTFEGEDGSVGSTMSWEGKKTGAGKMLLSEANGKDTVCFDLEFIKPFKGFAKSRVTLEKTKDGVEAEWHYEGEQTIMARIFAIFMNFERMIGGQYDKGLSILKGICEGKKKS